MALASLHLAKNLREQAKLVDSLVRGTYERALERELSSKWKKRWESDRPNASGVYGVWERRMYDHGHIIRMTIRKKAVEKWLGKGFFYSGVLEENGHKFWEGTSGRSRQTMQRNMEIIALRHLKLLLVRDLENLEQDLRRRR